MVRAYVTIASQAGASRAVVEEIRGIDGVTQADIVAGDVDIIAQVEADAERDLLMLVTDGIQRVEGVARTRTCIVLE